MKASKFHRFALILAVLAIAAPVSARTRAELEVARASKAETAALQRSQVQARARGEAQARLRQQYQVRARLNAVARANALASQKRAAEAAAGAARAQMELGDAIKAARSRSPALANYRKWAGNKMVWHHFQGVVPPEELRRAQRERERDAGERGKQPAAGCAAVVAGNDGARPGNCETPGS